MEPTVAPSWLSHPLWDSVSATGPGTRLSSAEGAGDSAGHWLSASTRRVCRSPCLCPPQRVWIFWFSCWVLGVHGVGSCIMYTCIHVQCIIIEQRQLQPFPSTQVIPTAMLKKYENKHCEGVLLHWNKNITLVEWEKRMFYWQAVLVSNTWWRGSEPEQERHWSRFSTDVVSLASCALSHAPQKVCPVGKVSSLPFNSCSCSSWTPRNVFLSWRTYSPSRTCLMWTGTLFSRKE